MVEKKDTLLRSFKVLRLLYILAEFPREGVTFRHGNQTLLRSDHHHHRHRHTFSYSHPERWLNHYHECNGEAQSPIHIISNELQQIAYETHLTFNKYEHVPSKMFLINDGHTIQIKCIWEDYTPHLSGGPLNGTYTFEQLHFHWDMDNFQGSEHKIDDQSFVLEMHAVHYKTEYGNMRAATEYEDGLVVTAYLFQIMNNLDTTYGIRKLKRSIRHIRAPVNERNSISPFPLSLFDLEFRVEYIMYKGSLTIPPCTESVLWLIDTKYQAISPSQFEAIFNKVRFGHHNRHNHRPLQPINDREVYYVMQ